MTKNFNHLENQNLWNLYEQEKLAEGSPQISISQYKPACLALEKFIDGTFDNITAKQLDQFIQGNMIKNTSHIRGFLLTVITKGFLTVSKDVLAYLIPQEYKKIVELLIA